MYIYYDTKTDYVEILYLKGANYGESRGKGVIVFRSEKSKKVVGYGIEAATGRIEKFDLLSPFEKLSILIRMARSKRGYTQAQMAKMMGIKPLPYQRLESGKNNPTLRTLLKLKEVLPEVSLSNVA